MCLCIYFIIYNNIYVHLLIYIFIYIYIYIYIYLYLRINKYINIDNVYLEKFVNKQIAIVIDNDQANSTNIYYTHAVVYTL